MSVHVCMFVHLTSGLLDKIHIWSNYHDTNEIFSQTELMIRSYAK